MLGVVGATDSDGRRDLHAALVRRHGARSGLVLLPAAAARPAAGAAGGGGPAAGAAREPEWLAGLAGRGLRIFDPDVGFPQEDSDPPAPAPAPAPAGDGAPA